MTTRAPYLSFSPFLSIVFFAVALGLPGCGGKDDEGGQNMDAGNGDAGLGAQGSVINAAALRACPQATSLVETTEWMSCLAGKRISGTELFNQQPCELRIGADGVFEYLRGGEVALQITSRSSWRAASGLYQNTTPAGGPGRIFLGSITPDLAPVDGQPWITNIDVGFFDSLDDKVEVKYFDASRNRQTYNCRVNVL